jgi:DNA-binding XRE family transcriptional regulator
MSLVATELNWSANSEWRDFPISLIQDCKNGIKQIIYYLHGHICVYLDNMLSVMGKYSVIKMPSEVLRSTAKNVAELRKELSWTQQGLSEKSGVSYGSIKRFERSGKISFESLLKIAECLNRLSEFENILLPRDDQRLKKLFESHE